ncbi:MAG: cation diffusion facilitator family transporter [Methanobacteriaceae archaeon]
MDPLLREKEGKKAAAVGIGGNIILTLFNLVVGYISGSYALIAEGAHTLSDIATSIIAYIGFKIGQKPADKEHPLGHGRAEALAGLLIVMFLAIIAYEVMMGAVSKLFIIYNGGEIESPSILAGAMALGGVFINLALTRYILQIGRKIKSNAIIADALHQRTDIFSCIAILICVIGANLGYVFLDPLVGFVIGLFIIKTAYNIGKDNINNIMGKLPSEEIIKEIEECIMSIPEVKGTHELKINYFGPYLILSLHIELEGSLSLKESHEIAHNVEKKIIEEVELVKYATIHVCPCGIDYEHINH